MSREGGGEKTRSAAVDHPPATGEPHHTPHPYCWGPIVPRTPHVGDEYQRPHCSVTWERLSQVWGLSNVKSKRSLRYSVTVQLLFKVLPIFLPFPPVPWDLLQVFQQLPTTTEHTGWRWCLLIHPLEPSLTTTASLPRLGSLACGRVLLQGQAPHRQSSSTREPSFAALRPPFTHSPGAAVRLRTRSLLFPGLIPERGPWKRRALCKAGHRH